MVRATLLADMLLAVVWLSRRTFGNSQLIASVCSLTLVTPVASVIWPGETRDSSRRTRRYLRRVGLGSETVHHHRLRARGDPRTRRTDSVFAVGRAHAASRRRSRVLRRTQRRRVARQHSSVVECLG